MYKIINILLFSLIVLFFFMSFRYYSSNINISNKNFIRSNIDQILREKISDLPILSNDTDNVIEFNNSIENEINDDKKKFLNLLKKMSYKALIISLRGAKLSRDEMAILSKEKPWGVILFKKKLKIF